jgi:hypothetical protein
LAISPKLRDTFLLFSNALFAIRDMALNLCKFNY